MSIKMDTLGRKGITQADWAISLGLFILYLAFVFVIARPIMTDQLPGSSTFSLLDTLLDEKASTDITTIPFDVEQYTDVPVTILPFDHNLGQSSFQMYPEEYNTTLDFVLTRSILFVFQEQKTPRVSLMQIADENNRTAILGPTGNRTGTSYGISADHSEVIIPEAETEIRFRDNLVDELDFQGSPLIFDWHTDRTNIPLTTTETSFETDGFLATYDSLLSPTSTLPTSADSYPALRSQYLSDHVAGVVTVLHPSTEPLALAGGSVPESQYSEQLTTINFTTMITSTQTVSFNGSCHSSTGSTVALHDGTRSLVFHTPDELTIEACHLNETTEIILTYTHTITEPFWFSSIATDQSDPLRYRPQTGNQLFSRTSTHLDLIKLEKIKASGEDALYSESGIPSKNKVRLELIASDNRPQQDQVPLISIGPELPLQGDISTTSETTSLLTNTSLIPYTKRIVYTWT